MVSKNIKFGIFIVFLFLILINLGFVNAAVVVVSPVSNSNFTGTASFNVSYVNATDLVNAYNATFFYNLSGTWIEMGVATCNNGASTSSCNVTLDISSLTDGIYSINATVWNATANSSGTTITTSVRFDSTAPTVVYQNIVDKGNYSGVLDLNVTITDAVMGIDAVYFNITLTNGTQVNYTKASNQGNVFNVTINTSSFADGSYNITVYANDSVLNNLNNTEMILVVLDNTNPGGSVSCTPSPVTAGATITCTCSPSDTLSGINAALTSVTANPSTSNTGSFTESCSFADLAGNTGSASTSYTVEIGGTGPGTTGTSNPDTYYTKTIPMTGIQFSELNVITQQLRKKERIKIKIDNETHFIGVKDLDLTKATIEIGSEPISVELDVGEDAKIDVNEDDFYDIYVKLNSIINGKADLNIEYLYEEIPAPTEGGDTSPVDTSGDVVVDEPEPKESNVWMWILVIGLIVVIIGVVVYLVLGKNQIKGIVKKR